MFSPLSNMSSPQVLYQFGGAGDPMSASTTDTNSDSNSSTMCGDIKLLDLNADNCMTDFSQFAALAAAVVADQVDGPGAAVAGQVRMVICEQPVDKFRFRYKSEMHGTHGSLTGASSGKKKTYPSVRLQGFAGDAIIRCSLHQTDGFRERLHSHSLVVRRDNQDCRDPHDVLVNPEKGFRAEFPGMGIIHTAKKFIKDELLDKLLERQQMLTAGEREITELERERLSLRAESEAKMMNLNQVCLCFEAFRVVGEADGSGGAASYEQLCEPVYSRPINNMKSALTGELKITRLSTTCCDAAGNSDLFLFVEKVGKKNIQVRFFELDENEDIVWQDYGQFAESDVHHQYAIALRTPPYRNKDIEEKVDVFVELYRKSDQCRSVAVQFQYKPRSSTVTRKRARICSSAMNSAELPTVLHNLPPIPTTAAAAAFNAPDMSIGLNTISVEYNKSDLINELLDKKSEELFTMHVQNNSKEWMDLMDEADLEMDGAGRAATGGWVTQGAADESAAAAAAARDNRIEARVRLLRSQIDRVARTQSRQRARDYLHQMWLVASAKMDILYLALHDGETTAQLVIQLLADYELTALLNMPDAVQHQYALHTAVEFDRPASIVRMLQLGADPNRCNLQNNTPLHLAVLEASVECVAALCDARNYPAAAPGMLHIDATNDDGFTALHLAIRNNQLEMVRILTAAGASPGKREARQGNTGLHMAVQCNSTDIVDHLVSTCFVDVNERNTSNLTALELAGQDASSIEPGILRLLQGLDDDQKHADGLPELLAGADPQPPEAVPVAATAEKAQSVSSPQSAHAECLTSSVGAPEPLFDKICMQEMCDLFNADGGWKQLAEVLQLGDFVDMWIHSEDPTRNMFRFAEANGFLLPHIVNIFVELDNREALGFLDEMLARRMEKE